MDVGVVSFASADAPAEFTRSLHDTGFAVLVDHPVPQDLVAGIYEEWLSFFESDAKHAYRAQPGTQDGWFGPDAAEAAQGYDQRDLKEYFHVYPWSAYPSEVSDAALRYRSLAKSVAETLLRWLQEEVPPDVEAGFSRPLHEMVDETSRTLLRVLRYPPLTGEEPEGAVRAAAHQDINLITVLPAASEPGLQVLDCSGRWHDVPCDFGSLVINAGDMLAHATADYFPSTTHRVVNPAGAESQRSRMSLPLFLQAGDDVVLRGDRTALSFLQERLAALHHLDPPAS